MLFAFLGLVIGLFVGHLVAVLFGINKRKGDYNFDFGYPALLLAFGACGFGLGSGYGISLLTNGKHPIQRLLY